MSILSRLIDIVAANINAILDKFENSSKMVDQNLRRCENVLAKVKAETAEVMAQEAQAERVLVNCTKEIQELERLAVIALKKGEEAYAVELVKEKIALSENLKIYEFLLTVAKENTAKMRQVHDKLKSEYELFKGKLALIKAKAALVNMKEHINRAEYTAKGVLSIDKLDNELDKMSALEKLESDNLVSEIREKYKDEEVLAEVANEMKKLRVMLNT